MQVIDIEASGLDPDLSYPIEIGVYDTQHPETSISFLIKPDASWEYWDSNAESIHNISRNLLDKEGISLEDACDRLNLGIDQVVISDAPDFDYMWLQRLFDKASKPMRFKVSGFYSFLTPEQQSQLNRHLDIQERPHRALADARMIGQALRPFLNE
ncbi:MULTISPECIES: 3'-5' exonuclease [Nitrincola]|uniref:Exonuclease domain-containing protein n=1 Tax=Nitrincola nitratireducens TaxID=1229521 RepID=W9VAD5_9GAMM|nr:MULTISPECIES: exonuclease domain-containing protein [Nitrincola]EXJ13017.1 hypothetical protein D791_00360 [Nitrincola nitratireducens]